ncbi:40S ribosomal protein SA [Tupaia chinensis]|uniref:40S ribosomal protein SA n=1 Tax=Tupaia chinensis TaxID=246437 RepID=L9L4X6_TUPCH|nr:40S ribosomal protein SA [Tupaia chinensis]
MKEDVLKFLAAGTHLGGTNLDFQMEQYIYKRKSDGIYIINLKRTWEKLLLAAHAIVAIENPADISVISSRNTGQRVVLKDLMVLLFNLTCILWADQGSIDIVDIMAYGQEILKTIPLFSLPLSGDLKELVKDRDSDGIEGDSGWAYRTKQEGQTGRPASDVENCIPPELQGFLGPFA